MRLVTGLAVALAAGKGTPLHSARRDCSHGGRSFFQDSPRRALKDRDHHGRRSLSLTVRHGRTNKKIAISASNAMHVTITDMTADGRWRVASAAESPLVPMSAVRGRCQRKPLEGLTSGKPSTPASPAGKLDESPRRSA
jgi:hypothetical protein